MQSSAAQEDTSVKPLDLYRMLAAELGLRPGPRAQIVGDIKRALVTMVDERAAEKKLCCAEQERIHYIARVLPAFELSSDPRKSADNPLHLRSH